MIITVEILVIIQVKLNKHYYFTKRFGNKESRRWYILQQDNVTDLKRKLIYANLPQLDNATPKTSFECKPFSPKRINFSFKKELQKNNRSRVKERSYGLYESEIINEYASKERRKDNVIWLKI